jgi:hypothetical protein
MEFFDLSDLPDKLTINECLNSGANGVMISNEHYHALDGISGSNLALLAESNKHLDNKKKFNPDTNALKFGSLVHTLVLEPELVQEHYIVMPKKFGTKAETGIRIDEAKRNFQEQNINKIVIENEDMEKALKMARNVNSIAGNIINAGIRERSLFVKINGLICKCRLDIDHEKLGDDYDLKTIGLGTKDFSDKTLESHIKKFHYDWSAAFRNLIRRELGKPVRDSYLIFVNSGSGHMVRVIQIHPAWIKESEGVVRDLLESRKFYLTRGIDKKCAIIDDSNRHWRSENEY